MLLDMIQTQVQNKNIAVVAEGRVGHFSYLFLSYSFDFTEGNPTIHCPQRGRSDYFATAVSYFIMYLCLYHPENGRDHFSLVN